MCLNSNSENCDRTHDKIKILTWNVEGFMTKNNDEGVCNKLNVLYVNRMLKKFDIVCLNETWTNADTEKDIQLQGFEPFCSSRCYRNKKANRDSGGVAILVKNNFLKFVSRQPNVYEDSIWLKIDKNLFGTNKDIYLCNFYLPPENSSSNINSDLDKWDLLEREIQMFNTKGFVLLCGDLNARTGTQLDFIPLDSRDAFFNLPHNYVTDPLTIRSRCNLDTKVNNFGKKLLDMCIGKSLQIINGRTCGDFFGNYTCLKYNGNSTVDYNIISKPISDIVSSFQVLPYSEYSDHKPLSLEIQIKERPTSTPIVTIPMYDAPGKFVLNNDTKYNYIDTLLLPCTTQKIQMFNTKFYESSEEGIDNATNDFSDILLEAARTSTRFVKPKIRKRLSKPWFDANCFNARKNLLFYKKLYDKYPQKRNIRESYHSYAKFYRKLKRKSENSFKEDILKSLGDTNMADSKNFWNTFKKLDKHDGISQEDITASTWLEYYKNLNKNNILDEDILKEELKTKEENLKTYDYLDFDFTITEIKKHISHLKLNKSSGPDLISNEMVKYGKEILAVSIQKLFNLILGAGIYPTAWKKGIIVNIHKAGSLSDPSNYRGITLTSILGKLLSSLVNDRLIRYIDGNNLMSQFQAGFRQDHRTTDHMFVLHQTMKYYKNARKKLYIAFIDFHKAFDKLWRIGLLTKICNLKIGGNVYKLIKSMYSGNTSQVRINNGTKLTPSFPCEIGVRQGDSLSPTLFNIFVNDIANLFDNDLSMSAKINDKKIGCLFYADDLVLMSESESGLQHSLDLLNDYCNNWHLKVNESKTKVMLVQNSRIRNTAKLTFGGTTLEQVTQYKYLGITFNEYAQLNSAQDILFRKGLKAYYAMSNTLFSINQCNVKNYLACFEALIKPIIMYGCEIWATDLLENKKPNKFLSGQNHLITAEKLEIKLLKFLLGTPRGASNVGVRCEISQVPLRTFATSQILKYYNRLKLGSKNVLVQEVFQAICDSTVNPFSKFLTLIADCNVILPTPSEKKMIKAHTQKSVSNLKDRMYDMWDNEILLNRKLVTFNNVKESHDPDYYIYHIDDRHARKYLASFRLSCHSLRIEVGRYKGTPRQERICECCDMSVIENEEHFMTTCPLYSNNRVHLYRELDNIGCENWNECTSDTEKLMYLLQPRNIQTATLVIKYIKACKEIRKSYLMVSA